jgi:hypothetical protein
MRDFTHFEAPLGVCRVYFCNKLQKYLILGAKPHKLLGRMTMPVIRKMFCRPLVHNKYLAAKGIRFIMVKEYMLLYKINKENKTVLLYRFIY